MTDRAGRWWVVVVLGALALLLGVGLVLTGRAGGPVGGPGRGAVSGQDEAAPVRPPGGDPRDLAGALGLLHRWDEARAAAWSRGDVAALRGLYVTDASAGSSDVRMLRRYLGRGLVVRDLRTQVLRARLRHLAGDLVELQVTERLAGGVAATADGSRALPRDTAATRLVDLRRDGRRWRVASVRPG